MDKTKFIEWIYNNRFNEEVGNEEYMTMLELHFLKKLDKKRAPGSMPNIDSLQLDEVYKELIDGNILMAVKKYKEFSGSGLREAKNIIDSYRAKYFDPF
ncbi:MAG: hypothetical protein ABIP51_23205 [Bacteroidia bacterium]